MVAKRKKAKAPAEVVIVDAPKKSKAKKAPKIEVSTLTTNAYLARLSSLRKRSRSREDDDDDIQYVLAADEDAGLQPVRERLSTGLLALDRFLGGGWPIGRLVEIAAWEGIGKSTLLDQSIAMAQQQNAITALIDSEKARDRDYSRRLGANLDELIIAPVDTLEQGFEAADNLLAVQESIMRENAAQARPFLLFWDSLGGTPTKAELEGDAGDRHVAVQAIMIKQNFRRLCIRLNELRGCLVFTNQFYEKIGGMGGLATTGGSGVRYFTSLRLWLSKGNYIKRGEQAIGQIVTFKMKKTRVCSPKESIDLGLLYGTGFDNAWTLYEWAKTHGAAGHPKHKWVEQRGAWCYLIMPDTGQAAQWQGTFLGFGALLREQPDLYSMLATQYMQEGLAA